MAAEGPAGNLLVALGAFTLLKIGLLVGWFIATESASFDAIVEFATAGAPSFVTTTMLSVLLVLNVFLCVFNMLPFPPLDGAAVFGILLPPRQAERLRDLGSNGMMSMQSLVVAWQVFPLTTDLLFSGVLRLVHPYESYF